jgi:nucleotidyltransferase-like protein
VRLSLFGSTARGDAGPDSDVDLLALLTIRAGYRFWILSAWNWTYPICSAAKSI